MEVNRLRRLSKWSEQIGLFRENSDLRFKPEFPQYPFFKPLHNSQRCPQLPNRLRAEQRKADPQIHLRNFCVITHIDTIKNDKNQRPIEKDGEHPSLSDNTKKRVARPFVFSEGDSD